MSYVHTLPVELWLLIFELMEASSVTPKALCNPLTCPDLDSHLHLSWDRGAPCNKRLQDVRLVCRTFNTLLGSSTPFHYIMKDLDAPIPRRSKAVHIISEDAGLHFQRLLTEPLICGQLVTISLPGNQRGNSALPDLFEALCKNSYALSNLRNLTLGLFRSSLMGRGSITKFWSRLNSSFPHLVCLVLRGEVSSEEENSVVVFEKLEVLDLDSSGPGYNIKFPALRHAACKSIWYMSMWRSDLGDRWFVGWPRMESLLVREGRHAWKIDWSELPHLRLLATTSEVILAFPPLPPHHPLQHIYIDIGPLQSLYMSKSNRQYEELRFIKQINKLFPTITRITLVLTTPKKGEKDSLVGNFDPDALAVIGFTVNHSAGGAYWGGRRIVLERIQAASRSERLRAGWNSFRNAAFPAFSITSIVGK